MQEMKRKLENAWQIFHMRSWTENLLLRGFVVQRKLHLEWLHDPPTQLHGIPTKGGKGVTAWNFVNELVAQRNIWIFNYNRLHTHFSVRRVWNIFVPLRFFDYVLLFLDHPLTLLVYYSLTTYFFSTNLLLCHFLPYHLFTPLFFFCAFLTAERSVARTVLLVSLQALATMLALLTKGLEVCCRGGGGWWLQRGSHWWKGYCLRGCGSQIGLLLYSLPLLLFSLIVLYCFILVFLALLFFVRGSYFLPLPCFDSAIFWRYHSSTLLSVDSADFLLCYPGILLLFDFGILWPTKVWPWQFFWL